MASFLSSPASASAPCSSRRRLTILASLAALAAASPHAAQQCELPGCAAEGGLRADLALDSDASSSLGLLQVGQASKEQRSAQIPGLSDMMDRAHQAVDGAIGEAREQAQKMTENVTEQAREIAGNAAEEASSFAGNASTKAALLAASTLNKTLNLVGVQADALTLECESLRSHALRRLNISKAEASEMLGLLQEEVQSSVGRVLPVWSNISAAVTSAGAIASSALSGVGQSELGESLVSALNSSLSEADAFSTSLQNISGTVEGLSAEPKATIMKRLRELNKTLDSAIGRAQAYSDSLVSAFGDLTSKASAKLSKSLPGVNVSEVKAAFNNVDSTAAIVMGRVAEGPKVLLLGLGSAAGLAEGSLPKEVRSAAPSFARLTLSAALAVVAAVAMSA